MKDSDDKLTNSKNYLEYSELKIELESVKHELRLKDDLLSKTSDCIHVKDDWRHVTVEFFTGHRLKRYWKDKYWPKTTQCLIKVDGLIAALGEVIKHEKDIDNPKDAKLFSFRKSLNEKNKYILSDSTIETIENKILNTN